MALVAIHAVVDIPGYIGVLKIVRVVSAVTSRALKYGIVIRIRMARGANTIGIAMVDWDSRVLRVIECRTRPSRRVMAGRAGGREKLGLRGVARIGGVVVVGLMAADTRRRQSRVVVVDMTIGAHPRRYQVRAR